MILHKCQDVLTEWRALLAGTERDPESSLTERIREALGDTGVLEGDEEGQVNTRPAQPGSHATPPST